MRLSELVIIYLAIAAPFGVTHLLRRHSRGKERGRDFTRALGAALVWPAWALSQLAFGNQARLPNGVRPTKFDESLIERTKREMTVALRCAEDALSARGLLGDEAARYDFFAAREGAERYVGLALACAADEEIDTPTAREMELCRIAGRTGDDLFVAGRCIHRRNASRLTAHRERARVALETALEAVCARAAEAGSGAEDSGARRTAFESLTTALAAAGHLFNLLGDRETSRRVALRLEAFRELNAEQEAGAGVKQINLRDAATRGGAACTTQAAHRAFADPSSSTTTSTRG